MLQLVYLLLQFAFRRNLKKIEVEKDPIAAIVVGAMILKVSFNLFIPAINELLECSLSKETEDRILQIITEDPAVQDPHNLKTRKVGSRTAIEVHIRLDAAMTVAESHDITVGIENRLKQERIWMAL